MMNWKKGIALFSLLAVAGAAHAEFGYQGMGGRAGFRFGDPDQFVLGVHANLGDFAEGFRFQPMVDIGFGDHITLVTINPDVLYFPEGVTLGEGANMYFGAGLAIAYWKLDIDDSGCDVLFEPARSSCKDAFDESTTDVGLNLITGVEKELDSGNALIGEFRITIEDATFFQISGGYAFGN